MRRVRFRDPAGTVRTGEWTDRGIAFGGRRYDPESVDILPPCEPSKIVCVGLNYADHADELGEEPPDRPMLFFKTPNAVAGHGDTIRLLDGGERIEHEAEVGVVIDRQCRNVSAANAMGVVAGFTCVNDISNRDDQAREQNFVRAKAFDNSAPIGPAIVTPDEVPSDAEIRLEHNGDVKQSSSLEQLIFSVPELIEEITGYLTLEPGDVISTGTPSGVGPLADGDTVEVFVEGVGRLTTHVEAP